MRTRSVAASSTCVALFVILCCTTPAHAETDLRAKGFAALTQIREKFALPKNLYAQQYPLIKDFGGVASCWSAGVQLSALNSAAELDRRYIGHAVAYAKVLDLYLFKRPDAPAGYQPYPGNVPDELFYDDNAWLVLAFYETYKLTGDEQLLDRAKKTYEFMASGESDDLGGGIFWSDKKTKKNACINAPAICAALVLYEETKDEKYMALAERCYAWMPKLQREDGLYWDAIEMNGHIDKTMWSYNTALMIRANVMFARIKNDASYLETAEKLADAAEKLWFRDDGVLPDDAGFGHLLTEALFMLDEVRPRPETIKKIYRAFDRVVELGRNDLYPKRWDGWRPRERHSELLHQASVVRGFLYAVAHEQRVAARSKR